MSLVYDQSKYNNYKRAFLQNPNFNPITGRKIEKYGSTYNKLTEEFGHPLKEFTSFTNLPEDLQNYILMENDIVKSQRLSPSINKFTKNTYYNQLCDKPITGQEITQYIKNYYPDKVYIFTNSEEMLINVRKYISVHDDGYGYAHINEHIKKKGLTYKYNHVGGEFKISITDNEVFTDLLSMYFIYQQRHCESIRAHYAKNKVLQSLDDYYHTIDFTSYASTIRWYLYLRTNLQQFPVLLPKNDFIKYLLTEDPL